MAFDDEKSSAEETSRPCESAAQQLQTVKDEINAYEARKLGDLKSSLEKFVAAQDAKVADYTAKYAELRNRWERQQEEIAKLYQDITRCFPDPLPAALRDCICKRRTRLEELDGLIAGRQKECHPCDVPAIKARVEHEKAKANLGALMDLVKLLDTALTTNGGKPEDNGKGGLIKSIREQLCKPDRASAFYNFHFILLRSHRSIQPDKLTDPKQKEPAELKGFCRPKAEATVYDTASTTGGTATASSDAKPKTACDKVNGFPLPRLLPFADYRGLLDCAWKCFNDTKAAVAKAESEAKRKEDELASWITERDAKTATLDADTVACLNALKPGPPCGPISADSTVGA